MKNICIVIAAALLFAACHGSSAGPGIEAEGEALSLGNVSLAVTAAAVTRAPMSQTVHLLGSTVAMRKITIRSPAPGRVLELQVQPGDAVRRGDVIARVVTRENEAARAGAAIARELDPESAKMIDKAVERYARGGGVAVAAPESGTVEQRLVSSGQFVNEFDPIVELIDPASIYVEAATPIDILRQVRQGMPAAVTSPLNPGAQFPARVAALLPAFNQSSVTSPVRVEFTGPERIRAAGAAVEVTVTTEYEPRALVIPTSALFSDPERGSSYVFVIGADGKAHRTTVAVGIRTPERAQVISGLLEGQRVITSGGYALSDGLVVRIVAGGGP